MCIVWESRDAWELIWGSLSTQSNAEIGIETVQTCVEAIEW